VSNDVRVVGVTDVDLVKSLGAVVQFATLEDIVRWPLGMIAEVVVQDEYTHDVVVRVPSLDSVHLVFDTT